MKTKSIIYSLFAIIILLNSCSLKELTVNKRLYCKGFYVDFNKKHKTNLVDSISITNKEFKIVKVTNKVNNEDLICLNTDFSDKRTIKNENKSKDNFIQAIEINKNETIYKQYKDSIVINDNNVIFKKAKKQTFSSLISAFLGSSFLLSMLFNSRFLFQICFVLSPFFILLSISLAYIAIKNYRKIENKKFKWLAILSLISGAILGTIWALGTFILIIMRLFSGLY